MKKHSWGWPVACRLLVVIVAASAVLATAAPARAEGPMGRNFGLGLSLGNPTSFTGKYYLNDSQAIDFHVGVFHVYGVGFWSDSLFLGGDYLFEVWNFVENGTVSVPFYAGPGVGLVFDTDDDFCVRGQRRDYCGNYDFGIGPRMPIGVGVQFQNAPFELFLELTPTMMIVFNDNGYNTDVDLRLDIPNFALVGRFYFE